MDADLLVYLTVLWVSLAAHEIAHCRVLDYLGDRTPADEGRLTWLPHKHLSLWGSLLVPAGMLLLTSWTCFAMWAKPVRFSPGSMRIREPYATIVVKLAGPAANAGIAMIVGTVLAILPHNIPLFAWKTLVAVLEVNLVLFLLNMLPLPPLDGGAIWLLAPLSAKQREVGSVITAAALILVIAVLPAATAQNPFSELAERVVESTLDLIMDGSL